MGKLRRFRGPAVLLTAIVVLEAIRSSGAQGYDDRKLGGRRSQTWLEILKEGDELHRTRALDNLLSRIEDPAEYYPALLILSRADLAPALAKRTATRLTELLGTDHGHPAMLIWTLGGLGAKAEVALPLLEELAVAPFAPLDSHAVGWKAEPEHVRQVHEEAVKAMRRIRKARESPPAGSPSGTALWIVRIALVLGPAVAVRLLFFAIVRRHTSDRERVARARLRWFDSAAVVMVVSRTILALTFLEKTGQPAWPWPLLGMGLLAAMVGMDFAAHVSVQALDQRLRGLGGSLWKNALPGFYFSLFYSSFPLVAFAFAPLGMFFVDGAGNLGVGWDVLATFVLVQVVGMLPGAGVLRALFSMEVPPAEKLSRVLERHRGAYRSSSMLRAFDSGFVNAFVTMPGRRIVASDALVAHFAEPELDAIICHELGHLQMTSETVFRLAYVLVVSAALCLGMAAVPWLISWRGPFREIHELLPFGLLAMYVVAMFGLPAFFLRLSRRWETHADAFAVETCRDPAALASGLVKLHELNWVPMEFEADGGEHESHPSLKKRLEGIYAHPRLDGVSNPWGRLEPPAGASPITG